MSADPTQWNKISSLPGNTGKPAPERQVVPGVPAVRQSVALARDEWVCTGCGAPIQLDESGDYANTQTMAAFIDHLGGCTVVAAIAAEVHR